MLEEIQTAVNYFAHLLRTDPSVSEGQIERFKFFLRSILLKKYKGHWYEDAAWRGSGFRSIMHTTTGPLDPVLAEAATQTGIRNLQQCMPKENFHLWIDPGEVEIRFEDSRTSKILYKHDVSGSAPRSSTTSPSSQPAPAAQPVQKPLVNTMQSSFVRPSSPLKHSARPMEPQTILRPNVLNPRHHTTLNMNAPPFMIKAK